MDGFNSIEELYKRLTPALKSKKKELTNYGMASICEKDIWSYLSTIKWIKATNLTLADMVNDIMTVTIDELSKYIIEKEQHN